MESYHGRKLDLNKEFFNHHAKYYEAAMGIYDNLYDETHYRYTRDEICGIEHFEIFNPEINERGKVIKHKLFEIRNKSLYIDKNRELPNISPKCAFQMICISGECLAGLYGELRFKRPIFDVETYKMDLNDLIYMANSEKNRILQEISLFRDKYLNLIE